MEQFEKISNLNDFNLDPNCSISLNTFFILFQFYCTNHLILRNQSNKTKIFRKQEFVNINIFIFNYVYTYDLVS